MQIILVDSPDIHTSLLPLTYTRPVGLLRVGIDTIFEKWRRLLPQADVQCQVCNDYLAEVFPRPDVLPDAIYVAANVVPDEDFVKALKFVKNGNVLTDSEGNRLAWPEMAFLMCREVLLENATLLRRPYDIFLLNGQEIRKDFGRITRGRVSAPLSATNTVIGSPTLVFVEEGASVEGCWINTTGGPVYIGRDSVVMEGSMLRGPLAVCDHATVNMGTKIYGDTTVGPWCKVGGELNNVVMMAYSNKAHDGFLGNAVVGQWCNLGAGCVASNLKNDYTPVKIWDYGKGRFTATGLQFCGLIMGDYSRCGINVMLNTGTVVGVGVNLYGPGFPRNFVQSFLEGGAAGLYEVPMKKFFDTAERMMARRGCTLTDAQKRMLEAVEEL